MGGALRMAGLVCAAVAAALGWATHAAQTFTVATYNLENYVDPAVKSRHKSPAARTKVREVLLALKADVLALQEIGSAETLLELKDTLKSSGLDYPYWEHATGADRVIFVAVLSRFPIVARHSHTNESFLLRGRRFPVRRGFAEVDIRVNEKYTFTLLTAHLKSRLENAKEDQADLREQEALLLREKIDRRLEADPDINLVVLGDLNDSKSSKVVRTVIGKGKKALLDTRPAERNGDDALSTKPQHEPPRITWTYHYRQEDCYERVDYLLLSPGMAKEWERRGTYVLTVANWGVASDHRPILATIFAENW
jgi:endonuclease/exonuclease/phosphatase family metal-dependent hydrolase